MTNSYAAELVAAATAKLEKVKAEAALALKQCTADLQLKDDTLKVKTEACESKLMSCDTAKQVQKATYEEAIKRTSNECQRSWWEKPYLHFGLGLATCGAVYGITRTAQ